MVTKWQGTLGALSPWKEETSLSTGTVQLRLRPCPSQKNTSEKAAFLLLVLCDFDSLVAALGAIAFQLLVHFCFDISCKSEKCILYVYICFCTGLHEFNPKTCCKLNKSRLHISWTITGTAPNTILGTAFVPAATSQWSWGFTHTEQLAKIRN